MASEYNTVKKVSSSGFYFSLALFIVILIITWVLKIYSNSLDNQKQEIIDTHINNLRSSIEEKKKDEKIMTIMLIDNAKTFLDNTKRESSISQIIWELDKISEDYSVSFSNFSYSKWKISLNASLETDTSILNDKDTDNENLELSYTKLYKFLDYFQDDYIKDRYFNLGFIWTYENTSWVKTIKFPVNFELK